MCISAHTERIQSRGAAARECEEGLWLPDDDSARAGRQDQLCRATPQCARCTHPSGHGLSLGIAIGRLKEREQIKIRTQTCFSCSGSAFQV